MIWRALQYRNAWSAMYDSCDQDTQETADRRLDYLREHGNQSRPPITKHLEDGIFELRAKNVRFLFYFSDLQTAVFVHAIVKKRDDVPPADIKLAKEKRAEIRSSGVTPDAIANQDKPSGKTEG